MPSNLPIANPACSGLYFGGMRWRVPESLEEKLQRELHLAGCGGGVGDGAGGSGKSRRCEDDQVRRVEVGAVEEVEELSPELKCEAFVDAGVLLPGKVPG